MKNFNRSRGFTIIEMLIVVFIIGVLAAVIAPRFTSSSSKTTRALAMGTFADSAATLTRTINQSLGTPADVTASGTLASTTGEWVDILVSGSDCVTAAYQVKYENSGAGQLDNSVKTTTPADCAGGATQGVYEVQGYVLSAFASPTSGTLNVTFAAVPEDLVLQLAGDRDGESVLDETTGGAAGRVQYTAATNGLRDVTIVNNIK